MPLYLQNRNNTSSVFILKTKTQKYQKKTQTCDPHSKNTKSLLRPNPPLSQLKPNFITLDREKERERKVRERSVALDSTLPSAPGFGD